MAGRGRNVTRVARVLSWFDRDAQSNGLNRYQRGPVRIAHPASVTIDSEWSSVAIPGTYRLPAALGKSRIGVASRDNKPAQRGPSELD
jgi:hypothetical protein